MGTPSNPPVLDGFLNGATVDTGSQSWGQIINPTAPLQLTVLAAPDAQDIVIKSGFLWDLTFSSTANPAKFGITPSSTSNAAVSTSNNDGVLGLASNTAPLTVLFADIRSKFIGTEPVPDELTNFVNAIDPSGSVSLALDTTGDNRNALWALSSDTYQTVAVLIFEAPASALSSIQGFVSNAFSIGLQLLNAKCRITFRLIISYAPGASGSTTLSNSSTYEIDISLEADDFEVTTRYTPNGQDLLISNAPGISPPTGSIFDRLSSAIIGTASGSSSAPKAGDLPTPGQGGAFNSLFSGIDLWYLSLQPSEDLTQLPDGTETETTGSIYWQINLIANWHSNVDVALALRYDSRLESFYGRLLFSGDAPIQFAKRAFDYDPQLDPSNAITTPLPPDLELFQLFNPNAKAPSQIPSKIIQGSVGFIKAAGDGFTFTLAATIIADTASPAKAANSAPDAFVWDEVSVAAVIQNNASGTSTALQLYSEFVISPTGSGSTNILPATFSINLGWKSGGSWLLHGHVSDFSVGLLVNFFDNSAAIGLLGFLTIETLDVLYTYDGTGEASSFYMEGVIVLGELELDLTYEYASGLLDDGANAASTIARQEDGTTASSPPPLVGSEVNGVRQSVWTFTATLGANSPGSDVGSILTSIAPNAAKLPDFIARIPVGAASGPNSAVKLIIQGQAGDITPLSIAITIGDFSVTFISISSPNVDAKRILRVEVDQIPLVTSIPLIKELPQPFDKLLYLWLDDDSGTGLLKTELDAINKELDVLSIPKIITKDNNDADPSLAVLLPDHHFMVLNKGTVVLDHRFGDAEANSTPSSDPSSHLALRPSNAVVPLDAPASASDGPTKGGLEVKLPFLTISGISLDYKQGEIRLEFDATVLLGPLTFSLIGFYIGVPLSSIHLDDLSKIKVDFGLHGLDLEVDIDPIDLAGVVIRDGLVSELGMQLDTYRGGISLGFETWNFLAVGEYASSTTSDFKSVFIYAKLEGPLVTLAFATISGVRVGIGYNSMVRSPSIKELPTFPFLQESTDSGSGGNLLAVLQAMTNPLSGTTWVTVKQDAYWVAAGLTLTAFGILSVTAVLMFAVRDGGFVISVFADGIAQMPPDATEDKTLFYVEIGMIAELNTADGYFTVQASLAPSSHVLVPTCRLTGGFALVRWFEPNIHSGDFVFTVGGFHRAYSPPAWYPVPDRLGVSFTLGSMINVTGTTYFAITPKCVMGGGALHLGLDVGPVSAWLDVALDVFIQFKPFHYTADLMVSVGVAISINVWFVHIRISTSVGASLHIEGPDPFTGTATVDFYLFAFTISFGAKPTPPPPLPLDKFYDMVHVPGPDPTPTPSTGSSALNQDMAKHKLTVTTGLYTLPVAPVAGAPPQTGSFPNTGAGQPWFIKTGTFSFAIGVDFALSAATIMNDPEATPPTTPILTPITNTNPPAFFSKPMHLDTAILSTLTVNIYSIDSDNTQTPINGFTGTMLLKDVPYALWGPYSEAEDPTLTKNPAALKDSGNPTLQLCMGVTVTTQATVLAPSAVQDFDPSIAFEASIGSFTLPDLEPVQKDFLASKPLYPTEDPAARWEGFTNDWKDFGAKGAPMLGNDVDATTGEQVDGMLKMAAHWLAWDQPPPSQDKPVTAVPGGRAPWELDGSLPVGLVGDLGEEYPVLPRESA